LYTNDIEYAVAMDPQFTFRFIQEVRQQSADPDQHRRVLLSAYEAVVRQDFDAFAEHLSDDVELDIRGCGRMDGNWRGRANVLEATRRNYEQVAEQKPEIESMVAQDNQIAVLFRESGVYRQDRHPYSYRVVQWFTFAGDKIRRIDEVIASV
jgi:ketosteroid isomerase-like protein